jgi:XTP/dITP diphosphohydrolase
MRPGEIDATGQTSGQPLIMTLATKNEGKQRELAHWMAHSDLPLRLVLNEEAEDVDETGHSFLENARLKARSTAPVVENGLVLAEDSGMVVDALDGRYGISPFPGIYSNRWLTLALRDELLGCSIPNRIPLDRVTETGVTNSDLCHAILALMRGETNRSARYCCGMALWHPQQGLVFETLESSELRIIDGEPRGANGFGYDPITVPWQERDSTEHPDHPGTLTMAELSLDEKNRISHRGRAFRKLLDFLQAQRYL